MITHVLTRVGILFVFALLAYMPFAYVYAADVTVVPVVVDKKAKVRDILKENFTIKNTSARKVNLFPSVNDIHTEEGKQVFVSAQDATDRETSLSNWIELSRAAIELSPGEERQIPFVIRVTANAIPGTYHASISFAEGSVRDEARDVGAPIAVNVEIQADIKEQLQLNKFMSDSIFFSGDDVVFNYNIENIGNQALQPKGEIRIYDRRGREVAAIPVNENGKSVSPEGAEQLASVWESASGFGKYKAFLTVDYGTANKAQVQDTVFFWIIPWQQLLGLFVGSMVVIIFLAVYFHKWLDARYHARFALAGGSMAMPMPFPFASPQQAAIPPRRVEPDPEPRLGAIVGVDQKRSILSLLKWKMIFMSLFSRRRKKSSTVSTSTQAAEVSAVLTTEHKHRSLKEAFGSSEEFKRDRPHATLHGPSGVGHTIDLKRGVGKSSRESGEGEHHVINLKHR
jgi:hypothetical protein